MATNDEFISVGSPLPRIQSAVPAGDLRVRIHWKSGGSQVVDLAPAILSHRHFIPLRQNEELFCQLSVSETEDSLIWPGDIELSAVWIEELAPSSLDNEEFRGAMDELQFSLDGMAARLGIARRLVADYRKDKPIPPAIALATRYLVEHRRRAG
jgi:hypothetical protein